LRIYCFAVLFYFIGSFQKIELMRHLVKRVPV